MTYFDCFVVAAWMFAIGWFLGAIYMQNQNEQKETPRAVYKLERFTECEVRLPFGDSASAD